MGGTFEGVVVKPDQGIDVGDLALTQLSGHQGTVRRKSGASITGIRVRLTGEAQWRVSWYPDRQPAGCSLTHPNRKPWTRTLEDGSYRLGFLAMHKDIEVVLEALPGFGVEVTKKATGHAAWEGETHFTVKGHRLRLHVVDPEGHAVLDGVVYVAGYAKGKRPASRREYEWHRVEAGPGGVLDLWGAPGSCIVVRALDITAEELTEFVLPERTWSSKARLVVLRPRK